MMPEENGKGSLEVLFLKAALCAVGVVLAFRLGALGADLSHETRSFTIAAAYDVPTYNGPQRYLEDEKGNIYCCDNVIVPPYTGACDGLTEGRDVEVGGHEYPLGNRFEITEIKRVL